MDEFLAPDLPYDSSIEQHLNFGADSVDPSYARHASGWVERYTGHILVARTVSEQISALAGATIRAWPILPTSIPTVTYLDAAGASVAITGARLDLSRRPARLLPAIGSRWPTLPCDTTITVSVRAGYEDLSQIPTNFLRAVLVLIGAFDADREGGEIFQQAEKSARSLCGSYRNRRV